MVIYNRKTETLFNRGEDFKVLVGDYRRSEFAFVNHWSVSQKLDGTSGILDFRVAPQLDLTRENPVSTIHGRTAKAQFNTQVLDQLGELIDSNIYDKVAESMVMRDLDSISFYGEVVGPKVQNGGRYRNDIGFYVFDIIVNDKVYLNPATITEVCQRVGLDEVPFLGIMSTAAIVDLVRGGQQSVLTNGQDFIAEGIVAKSPFFDNMGKQIKFKLKASDF